MKLSNYFIRKKVKAMAGRKGDRTCCFCSLKDARHILVLCNMEDKEAVEPCLKDLRKQNQHIDVCLYVSGKPTAELNPSYMLIQSEKDLDLWYKPKEEVVKKFNACDADLIIDLSRRNNYVMQYLLLQHPAAFKVGARNNDTDLYDLSISLTESTDIKHLIEQLLFYLQSIRSK